MLERKVFTGSMDSDTEDRLLAPGDYRYALNCRIGNSDNNNFGSVENVKGNTLIEFDMPDGTNIVIGHHEDQKENSVIYFVYNSEGDHQILQFFPDTLQIEKKLKSSALNFQEDYLITGSAIVEGGTIGRLLYWTDDFNEPGKINLSRDYEDDSPLELISHIKLPPLSPPIAEYKNDLTRNVNNLRGKRFQFSYRYVYVDGEKSSYSPASKYAVPNFEFSDEANDLSKMQDMSPMQDNSIHVSYVSGNQDVSKIEIVAREGVNDPVIIATINKVEEDISDNTENVFVFKNNENYSTIDIQEYSQIFSNIPRQAKALDVIDSNRLVIGNIIEGYDLPTINVSSGVIYRDESTVEFSSPDPELEVSVESLIIPYDNRSDTNAIVGTSDTVNIVKFSGTPKAGDVVSIKLKVNHTSIVKNVIGDEELEIEYTVLPSDSRAKVAKKISDLINAALPIATVKDDKLGFPVVYTGKSAASVNALSIKQGGVYVWRLLNGVKVNGTNVSLLNESNDNEEIEIYLQTAPVIENTGEQGIIHTSAQWGGGVDSSPNAGPPFLKSSPKNIEFKYDELVLLGARTQSTEGDDSYQESIVSSISLISASVTTKASTSCTTFGIPVERNWKRRATHKFGIVYYDWAGRASSVLTNESLNVYVQQTDETPDSTKNGRSEIRISINHKAPAWASKYQILYGGNDSYNSDVNGKSFWVWSAGSISKNGDLYDLELTGITDYVSNNESWSPYEFVKGDRVRILRDKDGSFFKQNEIITDDGCVVDGALSYDYEVYSYDPGSEKLTFIPGDTNIPTTLTSAAEPVKVFGLSAPSEIVKPISGGVLVEVYRSGKSLSNESILWREIGECYNISGENHFGNINSQRFEIGITTATILLDSGDSWYREIKYPTGANYFVEQDDFSNFYKSDFSDAGRANVVNSSFREVRFPTRVIYTEAFVPDSLVNGLSTILDTSFEDYDRDHGSIQKMYTEDKRIIVFQELKVGQVLVNESILRDQSDQAFIATSTSILSDIVYFAGEWGIGRQPESFAVYGTRKYFIDIYRGSVLRLSRDGITEVSEVKMHNYWTDICRKMVNSEKIDRVKVYGAFDVAFDEYVISPAYHERNDKGVPIEYRETLSFNEKRGWVTFYGFLPEYMGAINVDLISYKDGQLYLHNDNDLYNNFYQTQQTSDVEVVMNEAPTNIKTYRAIEVEANTPWAMASATNQQGQETSLTVESFRNYEGYFWSEILRDTTTPNVLNPLLEGKRMRSYTMNVKLTNDDTELAKLFSVGIKFHSSELSNR